MKNLKKIISMVLPALLISAEIDYKINYYRQQDNTNLLKSDRIIREGSHGDNPDTGVQGSVNSGYIVINY